MSPGALVDSAGEPRKPAPHSSLDARTRPSSTCIGSDNAMRDPSREKVLHWPTQWCERQWGPGVDDRAGPGKTFKCHHRVITPHACLACHRRSPRSVHVRLRLTCAFATSLCAFTLVRVRFACEYMCWRLHAGLPTRLATTVELAYSHDTKHTHTNRSHIVAPGPSTERSRRYYTKVSSQSFDTEPQAAAAGSLHLGIGGCV